MNNNLLFIGKNDNVFLYLFYVKKSMSKIVIWTTTDKCIYSYWLMTTIGFGPYIAGRETSEFSTLQPRDKGKDYRIFLKYIIAAPIFVPFYLYRNYPEMIPEFWDKW